jgi:hypothetical protein
MLSNTYSNGLRVFEKRMLRRILGPKGEETNAECYNLYSAPDVSSLMEVKEYEVGRTYRIEGKMRNA